VQLRDLLPWRELIIDTSWSPSVAAIELRKSIQGPPPLSGGDDALFSGRVEGGRFHFSRRVAYKNSFLPVIQAVVEPSHHDGARVRIRMRLHAFVLVFVLAWTAIAAVFGVAVAISVVSRGRAMGLVGLLAPLFGVAIGSIPFALEARNAERLLRDVFARAPALPEAQKTGGAYR